MTSAPKQLLRIGKKLLPELEAVARRAVRRAPECQGYDADALAALAALYEGALRYTVTNALVERREPGAEDNTWVDGAVEARSRAGVPPDAFIAGIPVALQEV